MNKTELARYNSFAAILNLVSDVDIAWFSGWLCADGSINVDPRCGRPHVKFSICDKDPLERMAGLFSGKILGPYEPSGFGKLQRFNWSISGMKAALLLGRCIPWLSNRYKEKALRGMKYDGIIQKFRVLTPEAILDIKNELLNPKHGTGTMLARKHNVSDGLISAIKHGRVWSNITQLSA